MKPSSRYWLALVVLAACATRPQPSIALVTTAERTQYTRTGRYDEVVMLCHAFARAYAGVRCNELGRTTEDRPIVVLRVERAPASAPQIYIQAGIHAGEIEGKDAGFWFVRDLLDGKVAPGVLAAVNVAFVPVVNPDGHERFAPNQRPNQRGPIEGGFRTTAARLNMNRDFVKADAPETQAVLRLLAREAPVLFIDLHTTDGAKFQQDISINFAPLASRGDGLAETAATISHAVVARVRALGNLPVEFYPAFVTDDDPASGFEVTEASPRFGQAYYPARSRLAVLVETHSWRTYKERAISTYHALQAIFELATHDADAWLAAEHAADRADRELPGTRVPMTWQVGPRVRTIDFLGYAYTRQHSDLSGADWITYDETRPEVWHVPVRDEQVPKITVLIPKGGYIVDGGFAPSIAAILDRHAIAYRKIAEQTLAVDVFRATKVTPAATTFEGRTRVEIVGAWTTETRTLDRNAIFVPSTQRAVRLIAHLLDPTLPDSLAQWGELSAVFERKEYLEPYMLEQIARDMIAADPQLAAAFASAIAADPQLAKNPAARLDWFYARHPAWDERVNLLPIYRVDRELR